MKVAFSKLQLRRNSNCLSKIHKKTFKFTIGHNTKDILNSSKVNIYSAPEMPYINNFLHDKGYYKLSAKGKSIETRVELWRDCVFSNEELKAKYFSLLPLMLEDGYTLNGQKKFVLEMNLLPESKYFHFKACSPSGILEFVEHIEDIIPITPEDYKVRHTILRSRPSPFADMDMIYTNYKTLSMLIFDKKGTWNKEGVEHELLNVENIMDEHRWFDHLKSENYWH